MIQLTKVVKAILVINLGMFLLSLLLPMAGVDLRHFMLHHPMDSKFESYQLLSHMFLHFGLTHLIFNMLFLVTFGPSVEDHLGYKKFLIFYLLSGLGAASMNIVFSDVEAPMLGASGAIFGIIGIYTVMYPNHFVYLFGLLRIKVKFIFTILIFTEFILAVFGSFDGVAHFAHFGGALVGIILFTFNRSV
jgi:membrane associated rhomboid family serine protease